jgi:hypothetical protein
MKSNQTSPNPLKQYQQHIELGEPGYFVQDFIKQAVMTEFETETRDDWIRDCQNKRLAGKGDLTPDRLKAHFWIKTRTRQGLQVTSYQSKRFTALTFTVRTLSQWS